MRARLLYAAVREALTNAVRHAGRGHAHRFHPPKAPGYRVGDLRQRPGRAAKAIREGDGLQQSAQAAGAGGRGMEIVCLQDGVVLIAGAPLRQKTDGRRKND
jgi:anti-sigma regulatory factor (Ser/Thr protein kinase)